MKSTIEVIIGLDGGMVIDAVGFKGADCDQATRYLEEALGVAKSKTKKPEYHQRSTAKRRQKVGS